jgi:hypothetical protein
VDIAIFKTLDVSIFPGANYDLKLQITRSLSDFLHKYFSLESVDNDVADLSPEALAVMSSEKEGGLSMLPSGRQFCRSGASAAGSETSEVTSTPGGTKRKSVLRFIQKKIIKISDSSKKVVFDSITSMSNSNRTAPMPASSNALAQSRSERSSVKGAINTEAHGQHQLAKSQVAKASKQEGVYIKYMRVGDINVDVSTLGFTLNLDKFKAVMEPFFCRGELLTWKRLIWLFERHLVWSLTKNTAATSLTRLGEMFRLKPSQTQAVHNLLNRQGDELDPEHALALKRALLLGSPRNVHSEC